MNRRGQMGIIIGFFTILILILIFSIFMPITQSIISNTSFADVTTGLILNQLNLLIALVLLVLTVTLISINQ